MSRARKTVRVDLARMLSLLEQEQKALRHADMPSLIRLAPRKQALLGRLETGVVGDQAEQDMVAKVRRDASRNAALFEAALRGLKDARALVERYKSRRDDQTYARNGARCPVAPPKGTMERRA